MEQNGFTCTGDCLKCSVLQRQYCAAQFTYNSMRMLEELKVEVKELKEKMESNDTALFNPTIAQEGDGAENSDPNTINN